MDKQPKSDLTQIAKEFTAFIVKELGIQKPYKIKLSPTRTEAFTTHAYYNPSNGEIGVCINKRQTADVLRSLAHEMIHHKQNQEGRLKTGEEIPDIGGEIEDEANSVAGQLVKKFGYTTKHQIYE